MEERFSVSASSVGTASLSGENVMTAANAVCGANRVAAAALRAVLGRFVARPGTWATQAKRMSRVGFSMRHLAARFADVLDLAGDLSLVLLPEGRVLLMRRKDERWFAIDAGGQDVADCSAFVGEMFVEAVVLRMPLSWDAGASLAS